MSDFFSYDTLVVVFVVLFRMVSGYATANCAYCSTFFRHTQEMDWSQIASFSPRPNWKCNYQAVKWLFYAKIGLFFRSIVLMCVLCKVVDLSTTDYFESKISKSKKRLKSWDIIDQFWRFFKLMCSIWNAQNGIANIFYPFLFQILKWTIVFHNLLVVLVLAEYEI